MQYLFARNRAGYGLDSFIGLENFVGLAVVAQGIQKPIELSTVDDTPGYSTSISLISLFIRETGPQYIRHPDNPPVDYLKYIGGQVATADVLIISHHRDTRRIGGTQRFRKGGIISGLNYDDVGLLFNHLEHLHTIYAFNAGCAVTGDLWQQLD